MLNTFFSNFAHAIFMSLGMFWEVGWSLVLGFMIASAVQVLVPKERLQALLSGDGVKQLALATGLGAISSSCSYASASVARTLFNKGASLVTSLAFLFASTNLVIELGLILFLLMGWQFMVAEWLGGVVLIIVMSLLVRLTCPRWLIDEARANVTAASSHVNQHHPVSTKLNAIAQHFVMDIGMLWKDIAAGFLIAGFMSAFVPQSFWQTLFVTNAPSWIQVPLNALIGPLIALISFVCSIGNVPMAAILWGSGISFGGVLAFLYGDLIVLPLLDVYRRYFGWKMAIYIGAVFYATMVLTGILMDLAFAAINLIPEHVAVMPLMEHGHFSFNYTFWLNLFFGLGSLVLIRSSRKTPAKRPPCCCGHDG